MGEPAVPAPAALLLAFLLAVLLPSSAAAQTKEAVLADAPRPDTLHLGTLRAAAAARDPRSATAGLLERATQLRLQALRTTRLPQFALTGEATVQNEVAEIPIRLPGQDVPRPPHEQYRVQAEADWMLYDGGRLTRQADAERARLAEQIAGTNAALHAVRDAVTEAFFGALLFDARARALAAQADALETRLTLLRRRVAEGAALAADAASLEAELIRVREQVREAAADRRATLAVLADLAGRPVPPEAALALPDLAAETQRALATTASPDAGRPAEDFLDRPELTRLDRTIDRLAAEARVRAAETRPHLSLFGQAGLGRPSPLDLLSDEASPFGRGGLRLRWSPFDWGRTRREARALRVQARATEAERAAYARQLLRAVEDERADLERLETTLAQDDRAVTLREEALRVARRQLDEGVLLPDAYADRLTALTDARLTRDRHRIERAHAQARLLATLGRFPSDPAQSDARPTY